MTSRELPMPRLNATFDRNVIIARWRSIQADPHAHPTAKRMAIEALAVLAPVPEREREPGEEG